jgi:hypothetical protein
MPFGNGRVFAGARGALDAAEKQHREGWNPLTRETYVRATRLTPAGMSIWLRSCIALFAALASLFAVGAGVAAAADYAPGVPANICTGTGVLAGECGELKGIALDQSTGHVYVVDQGNARIDEFDSSGSFVRAFGAGVADGTTTAAQVCTATCFKGVASGTGAIGGARGIAVDPSTHIVYVAAAVARVAFFNGTTGAFIGQTEGNTGEINVGTREKLAQTTGIAVDNTTVGGPYLYVAVTTGSNPNFRTLINKFTISGAGLSAGSYLCQITGTATASSSNFPTIPASECGGNDIPAHKDGAFEGLLMGTANAGSNQAGGNLTVDVSGNVYIAESPAPLANNPAGRHVVSKFDSSGNFVTQFKPSGGALSATEPRPEALAALPSGNLLVTDGAATGSVGGSRVQEYNPATILPAVPPAVTTATPRTEFGQGAIGGGLGVAGLGSDVYVADKINKKIWKYTAVASAPEVITETPTAISKFKATLHGSVTPNFGDITDCHVEYGATISYGATVPCVPINPGSGNNPVMVSAEIRNLSPGETYHFKLVAANSVDTVSGEDLQFTTTLLNKPEVTTTPGATEILQTTARVGGTVNPNEVLVTDCHINYGKTPAYGLTKACEQNPGGGELPVDVTAGLLGLDANTTYHFQVEATNEDGTVPGSDRQFKTLPDAPSVGIPGASEVTQVSAKVTDTVNPSSAEVTKCEIEYGPTIAYGSKKPCDSLPGSGSAPVEVGATLTGLTPSTLYHFRVIAENVGGLSRSGDQTIATLAPNPPAVSTDEASAGLGRTFTLEGHINPAGLAVDDCHFAYGISSAYGRSAPCTPPATDLGVGNAGISVTAVTGALEPNTIYHFRLISSNLRGASQGRDRTFTTGAALVDSCANADIRAAQGIEVSLLPDCMALEQVSPVRKANQGAQAPTAVVAEGSRVLYASSATLGGCPNVHAFGGDFFVGVRDQNTGWEAECVNPPTISGYSYGSYQASFSPDLSSWFQTVGTPQGPRVFQERLGGLSTPISPPLVSVAERFSSPLFKGSSADHSHVYVSPDVFGGRDDSFVAGDPAPAGQGEDPNLYVAHLDSDGQPVLDLLAREGGTVWGGNCGARLGGMEPSLGSNLNLSNGERNQGAVSANGNRVYFSTRPDQPAVGDCTEVNKKRIMVREETPAGPKIEGLINSECDRVSPACNPSDGDDVYQGASVDQSRVYFTTSRQLANNDLDGSSTSCDIAAAVMGCDLYLYDANRPAGNRLIDVSAGDSSAATPGSGASVRNSITAISADGSHAYFVARTVLTADPNPAGDIALNAKDNLYLYSHPQEELSFVGTLASSDGGLLFGGASNWANRAYAVPIRKANSQGEEIGGDGHVLLFNSAAQLTAGDTDAARDIYRFDADAGTLQRVSKAAPGGSDNGTFNAQISDRSGSIGTDYAEQGRWVSEDGATVVFSTEEALLPGDTNDVEDSYLWRHGQLFHLPGSALSSNNAKVIRPVLSYDGAAVAYHSTMRLTASDGDTVADVYILRPGGGFRTTVESVCEGEACQGAPGAGPGEVGATSGSFSGAGNVRAVSKRCPKGKRKAKRGGRVSCVKPAKHKKQASPKRASAKQGGQK